MRREELEREAEGSNRRVQDALLPIVHAPADVVSIAYSMILALEGAADAGELDVEGLRRLVERFGAAVVVETFTNRSERRRWLRFADRLPAVVEELERGDAASARRALEDSVASFAAQAPEGHDRAARRSWALLDPGTGPSRITRA